MKTRHIFALCGFLLTASTVWISPVQARDGAQFNQRRSPEPDAFLRGTMGVCRLHRHIGGHFSIDTQGNLVNLTDYCLSHRNRGVIRETQLPESTAVPFAWSDRLRKISYPNPQKASH